MINYNLHDIILATNGKLWVCISIHQNYAWSSRRRAALMIRLTDFNKHFEDNSGHQCVFWFDENGNGPLNFWDQHLTNHEHMCNLLKYYE